MSKYVVIPISISLKNNKFGHTGDVVDESQLNTNTHDLVSGGFIRLATEKEIEEAGQVVPEEEEIEDPNLEPDEEEDEDVDSEIETKKTPIQEISQKDKVKNAFTKK